MSRKKMRKRWKKKNAVQRLISSRERHLTLGMKTQTASALYFTSLAERPLIQQQNPLHFYK